jgi:hypothetical protein
MLTATLAKGVKKRILVVEAMLSNAGFGPIVLPAAVALAANVGALVLEPLPGGATAMEDTGVFRADGDPDSGYTVVGQWWADLDDPFYASLLGVPFTVTVAGGDLSGGPAIGTPCLMSITVRLEKK